MIKIIVVVDHHLDNDYIMLQGSAVRVKKTTEKTITGLPTGFPESFDVFGTVPDICSSRYTQFDMM